METSHARRAFVRDTARFPPYAPEPRATLRPVSTPPEPHASRRPAWDADSNGYAQVDDPTLDI